MEAEKEKHSETEEMEDSDFDTSLAEDETASGKENVLRKRVTFDVSEESESEARKKLNAASEDSAPKESSMGKLLIMLTLVFVALSSFGFYFSTNQVDDHDPEWVIEQLGKNMRLVRSKFASQALYIWSDLYSGVERVLLENPTEPYVFLLLHQGTDTTSSCLARKVGGLANVLLNASKPEPLVLEGTTLAKSKDLASDGELFVRKYRPLVEQHRVLILKDLQLVPARTARGLRAFCNAPTPFVDRALYMVTLRISNRNDKENAKKNAEKELYRIWNELGKEELKSSVGCLTSGSVLWIEPEKQAVDGC